MPRPTPRAMPGLGVGLEGRGARSAPSGSTKGLISSDPAQRHPMLLASTHWLKPARVDGVDWHSVWTQPQTEVDPVIAILDQRLCWRPEDETVFFWMRESAVSLPWASFRRSWRPFLFSDEGPFLVNLRSPEVVCFGPDGGLRLGERPFGRVGS